MARKIDPAAKVIKAAFKLAAKRGWHDLTLEQIAAQAKLSLSDLRAVISSKDDILRLFMRQIDEEVLQSLDPDLEMEQPRDRLFEVLLRRFEVMKPHKQALGKIVSDLDNSPADWLTLLAPSLQSKTWMLAGAGLEDNGLRGAVKTGGLALVYARAFRVWLSDDDPGLAKTMATLDRLLRNGETWLRWTDVPVGLAGAVARFVSAHNRERRRDRQTET